MQLRDREDVTAIPRADCAMGVSGARSWAVYEDHDGSELGVMACMMMNVQAWLARAREARLRGIRNDDYDWVGC